MGILQDIQNTTLLVTAGVGMFGTNIYDDFTPPQYVQESRAQDSSGTKARVS